MRTAVEHPASTYDDQNSGGLNMTFSIVIQDS
jgi:hypothetical protein